MTKDAFVFVACGDLHAARTNLALRHLRRFSRNDVIAVTGRTKIAPECDQVITPAIPAGLSQHQASIFLKTSLHRILPGGRRRYCYLDNDIIAAGPAVDDVFRAAVDPISFAADHCHLRQFSPYAVNCRCRRGGCEHLRRAIRQTFGVRIAEAAWQHWNGGVFVFSDASAEFMERWHRNTLEIFGRREWRTRDQGSLAATVWQMGLQRHPTLPREFNFIVDPFAGVSRQKRTRLVARRIPPNATYALRPGTDLPRPALLHFINGGFGRKGWKNWDDAMSLLEEPAAGGRNLMPAGPLTEDNRDVHSLWIGPALSKLELLTIRSFLRHGHRFHLWVYGDLATALPREVILEDANEIIPQRHVMRKAETDPETGVGRGSFSSPFSDLFRYKLLLEKGGYWVDMDVTCLRPLNFAAPYVFRRHRVGVVGNIMKCPPRSRLMQTVYDQVARRADEHSEWLMPNRILSRAIARLRLTRHIHDGIWNEESWWEAVRPLALGDVAVPSGWVAIHWINEFWRVLKQDGGVYRGQRLFESAPDKERPKPGSALARLYAEYDLAGAGTAAPPAAVPAPALPAIQRAARQPPAPHFSIPSHLNVLLPSLSRGGAERSVLETLSGLHRRNSSGKLFLLHQARPSYVYDPVGYVRVHRLEALGPKAKLDAIAAEVLASPDPVLYAHMIPAGVMRELGQRGVTVVPVIQNSRPAWLDAPAAFDQPNIPFVVAVSEAVAGELRADACPRPVVVVRHELQRWFGAQEQQQNRRQIRERHGIADDALVLGMVGQFKSQKAYTRAVRVLAQIRRHHPAKLMILGGWDSDWGHGRQAYTAACRLALDLGVMTDLLAVGPVPDAERYYPAFDVFLNTSIFEGLSLAVLEAIQSGCPMVVADAGGNREVLPEHGILVRDAPNPAAFVLAITQAIHAKPRALPQMPPDFDLVPRLWTWLAGSRADAATDAARKGTLFVTNDLNGGDSQQALGGLLGQLLPGGEARVCVLEALEAVNYRDALERAGGSAFFIHDARDYLEALERILCLVQRLKVRNVCLWNVEPRIRLLLAKVLPAQAIRLIEAGSTPAGFAALEQSTAFQRRIAFSAADYWARLDHLVVAFPAPVRAAIDPAKIRVIPNGVPVPSAAAARLAPLPKGCDPELVIGAACPIEPESRIEFLIDMMAVLNERLAGVTLLLAGGVSARHTDYWPRLLEHLRARKVGNVLFTGPHSDASPHLRHARVFVTATDPAGSPMGILEAMALGIPTVAPAGDGPGPVLDGINGSLAEQENPRDMAHRVRCLLVNSATRRRLGETAQLTAARDFSVGWMARRYAALFDPPSETVGRRLRATPVPRGQRTIPKI